MCNYSSGTIEIVVKKEVPEKIIGLVEDEFGPVSRKGKNITIEIDDGWRMDSIISELEVLNPYVESGNISFSDVDGDATAEFTNGCWSEEWQGTYYMSALPDEEVSSTARVSEILNNIAKALLANANGDVMKHIMLKESGLDEKELRLYKLTWLKK